MPVSFARQNAIVFTLEQHGFELHRSTYTWIFSSKYCKCIFFSLWSSFNNIFSLACFIVRIQYIIHVTYQLCVNWLFMLTVRLPVNSRLLVIKFWGSQKLFIGGFSTVWRVSTPNPCVIQESTASFNLATHSYTSRNLLRYTCIRKFTVNFFLVITQQNPPWKQCKEC